LSRRTSTLIASGAVLTLAALVESLITGTWLLLVGWLVLLLLLAAIFLVPGARPRPVYDGTGNLVSCPTVVALASFVFGPRQG
jgi:hypothetical protein